MAISYSPAPVGASTQDVVKARAARVTALSGRLAVIASDHGLTPEYWSTFAEWQAATDALHVAEIELMLEPLPW